MGLKITKNTVAMLSKDTKQLSRGFPAAITVFSSNMLSIGEIKSLSSKKKKLVSTNRNRQSSCAGYNFNLDWTTETELHLYLLITY